MDLVRIFRELAELDPKRNTDVLAPRLLGKRVEAVNPNGMAITFEDEFDGVDESTVEIEERRL